MRAPSKVLEISHTTRRKNLSKRELNLGRELTRRSGGASVQRPHVESMARCLRFCVGAAFGWHRSMSLLGDGPESLGSQLRVGTSTGLNTRVTVDHKSSCEVVVRELDRVHKSLSDRNRLLFMKGGHGFPGRATSLAESGSA